MPAKTEATQARVSATESHADGGTPGVKKSGRAAMAAASVIACCTCAEPVHIEVVAVGIKDGHAMLTLSRMHSADWARTFYEVIRTDAFRDRAPDTWVRKRENRVNMFAVDVYERLIRVRDVPADAESLRQLMLAVRYAVDQTNAAKPPEDPVRADSSLNRCSRTCSRPVRVERSVGSCRGQP